jgi:hypothetical protein
MYTFIPTVTADQPHFHRRTAVINPHPRNSAPLKLNLVDVRMYQLNLLVGYAFERRVAKFLAGRVRIHDRAVFGTLNLILAVRFAVIAILAGRLDVIPEQIAFHQSTSFSIMLLVTHHYTPVWLFCQGKFQESFIFV